MIGKWTNGFNKELGSLNLDFEPNIKITYNIDKNNRTIILLDISEEKK